MENAELEKLRKEIDAADAEILAALARRMVTSRAIGAYKRATGIALFDQNRWQELLQSRISEAEKKGLAVEFVEKLYSLIHEESVAEQSKVQS